MGTPGGDVAVLCLTTLFHRYMKYLYPYECEKRGLSNPNELQAAIDSNRREGRRQGFGSSLFTYSPGGTHGLLSSPKLPVPTLGLASATNGGAIAPVQKIKKGNGCCRHCSIPSLSLSQQVGFPWGSGAFGDHCTESLSGWVGRDRAGHPALTPAWAGC